MYLRQMRSVYSVAAFMVFGLSVAVGQTQDDSQNALLKGSYRFRHVAVQNVDFLYNPTEITASYGTITFDGGGNYSLVGTTVDNVATTGLPQPLNVSGKYAIGSNGEGYLTNPIFPTDTNAYIYGAASQGVFTGSSTEANGDGNIFNDIFIAIPVGTAPTNASFTTPYQTGLLDFTAAGSTAIKNALFKLAPDGKGGFAAFTLNGQAANQSASTLTQSVTGATYNFIADGSANLTIPLPTGVTLANALLTGNRTMYQSADGNFILGWTATGYDIFFGVKALTTPATTALSKGLYFTTALEDAVNTFGVDSYFGGNNNTGNSAGDGFIHQRVNLPGVPSYDYGIDNQITLNADGTTGNATNGFTDNYGYEYVFGAAGQAFVAIGTNGNYSLVTGIHAANFSGAGVYLNPTGVVNAASLQPATSSIAPGELLVLFGTGFSSTTNITQGGQPFPLQLAGVTVSINNIACPIYYVTPTQLSVVVPYAVASNQTGLANIQVTSNGVQSNVVQMYLTDAAPGSFAQNANGIGYAAATHALTGQLITPSNPVQPGEIISLYLTGLGTVTPTVADGVVGPSNPLSWSDLYNAGNLTVYFDDSAAGSSDTGTISYAGLAPTLGGLYQINVKVPTTLTPGDDVYVEFLTDAADIRQIQIPYGGTASAVANVKAPRINAMHRAGKASTRAAKTTAAE